MCLPATMLHQTSALAHVEVADPLNTTTARITAITSCCERVFTQTTTPSRQSGIIDHGSRSAKQVSPLLFVVHNFAGCRPQRLVNDIPRSRRLVFSAFWVSRSTGLDFCHRLPAHEVIKAASLFPPVSRSTLVTLGADAQRANGFRSLTH